MKITKILLGLLFGLLCGPTFGQGYFGEGMVDALKQQVQTGIYQNQQGIQRAVQRAMADPQCRASYQQFLAQGGQLPYPQYAYQWVATGHFTAQGKRAYWKNQQGIESRNQQAMDAYREAERQRSRAQAEMQAHFGAGLAEQGRVMQGDRTYVDPNTGQRIVLPYLQPGTVSVDRNTGHRYVMGTDGYYYGYYPDGTPYYLPQQ